jgi:hypothetical protein
MDVRFVVESIKGGNVKLSIVESRYILKHFDFCGLKKTRATTIS